MLCPTINEDGARRKPEARSDGPAGGAPRARFGRVSLYGSAPAGQIPIVPVFEHRFEVDAPLEAVRAFHGSPEALRVLSPPGTFLRLKQFGPLEEGMVAAFRLWLGPVPIDWVARHEEVSADGFTDVMVEGPLARWAHRHAFEALGAERSAVLDRITYAHPAGVAGAWTRLAFGRPALASLFAYRAWATRRAVARG